MTKKELVDHILAAMPEKGRAAVNRLTVESVHEAFCSVAAAELLGGGQVALAGLGKLKVKATNARKGRDPRNGAPIAVPAGKKVVFAPSGAFRDALKNDDDA